MFSQILVGSGTSLVNFLIHATLLAAMVRAIHALSFDDRRAPAFIQHTLLIAATGVLLVAAHLVEVSLWAATYALAGAAPPGTHFIYFAFVNYTTTTRRSAMATSCRTRSGGCSVPSRP
jgi:hypothetical protein